MNVKIYQSRIINKYKEFFIPLIIGFLTQIPRIPHMAGSDASYVVYQAQLILNGYLEDWVIHVASVFGLYPFSGYPIGTTLLFSFFLLLCNRSVDLAVFSFSIFVLILSLVSNTLFLKEITQRKEIITIGNIFYILTPILYSYSYFTASARMMIFVLAPLQFYFIIKWQKGMKKQDLCSAILVTIGTFFFHRMSMAYAIFLFLAIIFIMAYKFWTQFANYNPERGLRLLKFSLILQIFLFFLLLFLSNLFRPINYKNDLTEVIFFKDFNPFLLNIINLSFDYFLFWGPMLIFALAGIVLFVVQVLKLKACNIEKFQHLFIMLIFIVFMSVFVSQSAYPRHILITVLIPFSIYPIEILFTKERWFHLLIGIGYTMITGFFTFFNFFWDNIGIYFYIIWIIFLFFLILSLIDPIMNAIVDPLNLLVNKRDKFIKNRILTLLLFLLVIGNSIILFDIRNNIDRDDSFPYPFTSDEEIEIAKYIENRLDYIDDPYITILASHYMVELRVGTYAGTLILYDSHQVNLLITGEINSSDVIKNATLVPIPEWLSRTIFTYESDIKYTKVFWIKIMQSPYYHPYCQKIIEVFNIRFFIKLKGDNYCYFKYGDPFYSLFAESIPEAFMVYETENLVLYQLS